MNTSWIVSNDIKRELCTAKAQALLEKASIKELGRYHNPPHGVLLVMRAAAVLMGYTDHETSVRTAGRGYRDVSAAVLSPEAVQS